jgi:hypothetical protein
MGCYGTAATVKHGYCSTTISRPRMTVTGSCSSRWRRRTCSWRRRCARPSNGPTTAYTAELAAREQAQAQAQAQAAQAGAPATAPEAGADGAPPPPPPPDPAGGATPAALPPLQPPVHHVPPKKPPSDDPTILTDAYALLERTFPEVTPEVHKWYLYFKHTPGKTTIMTLHDLRELCRLTKNPTEGRPVV